MISLDDAQLPMPRQLLEDPGGFAWWYLELLDEKGSGLVLIWSFGLPFLPGYASSARQGSPQRPAQRPSLNLALYEEHQLCAYALHEFSTDDVSWNGRDAWTFGETRIQTRDADGLRHVQIALRCPLKGSGEWIEGTLEASGPLVKSPAPRKAEEPHLWTPILGPSSGRAEFRIGKRTLSMEGSVYHDRNGGTKPLHDQGIGLWFWGHAHVKDEERIVYLLWPRHSFGMPVCYGFTVGKDGQIHEHKALKSRPLGPSRTFYGMQTWEEIEILDESGPWMRFSLQNPVDDGPFYLRYLCKVEVDNTFTAHGSAEIIDPDRIDMDRHRFLVKMRVSTDVERNSMWLPLFQGHKKGRVGNLLRSWARI